MDGVKNNHTCNRELKRASWSSIFFPSLKCGALPPTDWMKQIMILGWWSMGGSMDWFSFITHCFHILSYSILKYKTTNIHQCIKPCNQFPNHWNMRWYSFPNVPPKTLTLTFSNILCHTICIAILYTQKIINWKSHSH